jgi:hypothetical protein
MCQKLEYFSLASLSRLVMFVIKAGAYPSGAPDRCSNLGYPSELTYKHYTRLERLVKDKHSSSTSSTLHLIL